MERKKGEERFIKGPIFCKLHFYHRFLTIIRVSVPSLNSPNMLEIFRVFWTINGARLLLQSRVENG